MSELKRLIHRLYEGVDCSYSYIETIKHPKFLIQSLEELDGLIGNKNVKDSVSSQVSHLISIKTRSMTNSTLKEDKVMLNTLLYGDPGTGKTSIGKILAKVWYSLGYIDGSKKKYIPSASEEKLEDIMSEMDAVKEMFGGFDEAVEDLGTIFFSLLICYWVLLVLGKVIECGNSLGVYWTICLGLFLFTVFVMLLYMEEKEDKTNESTSLTTEHHPETVGIEIGEMPEMDDLITVVSRTDFVDRYSGWTDKKTLKILNDNLGKVLFVDEAYSLVSGGFDTFGIEVLNTITQFLSEHPGEIILIFAGYKHLIQRNLFSVQPGLCRRFMWQFECSGYNYAELFEIFAQQLAQKGWDLRDYKATKLLFRRNKDLFPNYGGDTEKLAFFCEMEHSKDIVHKTLDGDVGGFCQNNLFNNITNELTPTHIRRGIRTLRRNHIKSKHTSDSMSDMLQRYVGENSMPF